MFGLSFLWKILLGEGEVTVILTRVDGGVFSDASLGENCFGLERANLLRRADGGPRRSLLERINVVADWSVETCARVLGESMPFLFGDLVVGGVQYLPGMVLESLTVTDPLSGRAAVYGFELVDLPSSSGGLFVDEYVKSGSVVVNRLPVVEENCSLAKLSGARLALALSEGSYDLAFPVYNSTDGVRVADRVDPFVVDYLFPSEGSIGDAYLALLKLNPHEIFEVTFLGCGRAATPAHWLRECWIDVEANRLVWEHCENNFAPEFEVEFKLRTGESIPVAYML